MAPVKLVRSGIAKTRGSIMNNAYIGLKQDAKIFGAVYRCILAHSAYHICRQTRFNLTGVSARQQSLPANVLLERPQRTTCVLIR